MKKFICLFLFGMLAYVVFGEDSTADDTSDVWETGSADCEDGEIWLDSCFVCYCSCETEENADGDTTKTCESRCKDMKSRYASDYVMEYCDLDCRYTNLEFYDSCECPTCSKYNDTDVDTSEDTDDSRYYNVSDCNSTAFRFEWGTYTIHDGDEVDYIDECQACVCYSVEDADGVSFSKERCEEASWSGNWDRVASYCGLDCDRDYAVWDTSNCDCPSCSDTVQTDGDSTDTKDDTDDDTSVDDTTVADSDDDDDDSIYDTGRREYWNDDSDDDEGNTTHSIVAEFDITVTRIWDSRSDIWAILKRALRLVVKLSDDYVEDDVRLYISEWNAEVVYGTTTSDDVSSDTLDTTADASTVTSDDVSSDTVDTTEDASTVTSDDVSSDTVDTSDPDARRLQSRLRRLLEDSTADDAETSTSDNDTKDEDGTDADDENDTKDEDETDATDVDDTNDEDSTKDETDDDDSTRDSSDDDDEDSEEKTVNFKFAITFLDDDESNIDSWYEYLVALGTRYEDYYIDNCDSVSSDYRTSGFGTVTINSASLTQYSDDEVVESVEYDGSVAVASGSSQIYFVTIVGVSGLVTLLFTMFAM